MNAPAADPLFRVPLPVFDPRGVSNPAFPRLLSPIDIKGCTLRNRIAVSAHFGGWFVRNGLPSDEYAAYIEHRAAGGLGLFVVGATVPQWAGGPEWIQNTSEAIVPRYRLLADAAHRHGCKLFAQLLYIHDPKWHGDEPWRSKVGMHAQLAPPSRVHPWPPERSVRELEEMAADFGAAAGRAAAGGVDGLELHCHEGFLHAQFLSPRTNKRTDAYGGSLENRMRLMTDCLRRMREAIGDLPLGVRLKATDDEPGGLTTYDYVEVVKRLEGEGLADYLNFTGGDGGGHHGPMARPDGEWLPRVDRLKRGTKLPVMHAGRVTTPEHAEAALEAGSLDVVCMTKAHIADPRLTEKIYRGRLADVRQCTRCLQNCIGDMEKMSCVYNPVTSRERDWAGVVPAAMSKRVLVIGGGPAGMEAAVIAAERGHDVTVWERSARVGGQVNVAAAAPLRKMFGRIAEFYQRQAEAGRFKVELNREATPEAVADAGFDEVIVATGSREVRADVPGAERVLTPSEVLTGGPLAGHVLIVDRRGAYHAMLATDRLTDAGARVTFVTPLRGPGWGNEGMTREDWVGRLTGRGVAFHVEMDLVRIAGEDAIIRHRWDTRDVVVPGVDHVVVSAGSEPVNGLSLALSAAGVEHHVIGDANRPAHVFDATMGANVLARSL